MYTPPNDAPFPLPKDAKFTFIDLFSGIGGFRLALQDLGGRCVFSSDIDKIMHLQCFQSSNSNFPYKGDRN